MYKENPELAKIIGKIGTYIINPLIGLLFAVALVLFIFGIFEYFIKGDDSEARLTGGRHILWGFIGMVIMFGVYGILHIIIGTFGLDIPSTLVP